MVTLATFVSPSLDSLKGIDTEPMPPTPRLAELVERFTTYVS